MNVNGGAEVARARELTRVLDSAFRVPGTKFRFGLDPILGLVPGLGDAVGGILGIYLLRVGYRLGAPRIVLLRMGWNVAVDVALGSIPFLGDLFDAGHKANTRNLRLIERYLEAPARTTGRSRGLFALIVISLIAIAAGAVWLAASLIGAAAARLG